MKKLIKKLILLLIILALAILSSCFMGGRMIFTDDGAIIDKRFKQMVEAIENQDEDTFKSVFSNQVLAQFADFDEQISYLFEFIQGDIESWERSGGPGAFEGKNDDGSGRSWKEIRATYTIVTSEQKYFISLQVVTKQSQNPEKIGVSSFCIIEEGDWDETFNYWGDLGLPKEFKALGIFIDSRKSETP